MYSSEYQPHFVPPPPPLPVPLMEPLGVTSGIGNDDNLHYKHDDVSVSEKLISLSGIFQVLSHYYATPMFIHRKRYRSVEHYVCQKFFRSLKFNAKAIEKIVTTTDPRKLTNVVSNILYTQYPPIPEEVLTETKNKMNKWYEVAMKKKFDAFPVLRQLLLATGDALLIETNNLADKIMSIGVSEAEIQFLLTKQDVTPQDLMNAMAEFPESKSFLFRKLGQNRAGFMLMKLRNVLKQQSNEIALNLFEQIPVVSSLDYASDNVTCFTNASVLHPKYLCPIIAERSSVLYPSVDHYLFVEGAKFLCFPQSIVNYLLEDSNEDIRWNFSNEIWNRFPNPSKLLDWFSRYYDEILKIGCRLKFEQHPELLRVLLETSDSLLCYCHRFMTANSEWTIGIRESELREWKHYNRFSNGHLIDMMLMEAAKRPPFVGGNRLGFILMELRREFRLKGYQSYTLPLLISNSNNEILFGDTAGLETGDEYDSNSTPSKFLLWPSPFILDCKKRGLSVWYPGKRRLDGYYELGNVPDIKRQRTARYQCVHPEYVPQTPFSKVYSLSPELLNLANAPDTLKPYVVILLRSIFRLTSDVNEQNQVLELALNDIYSRNEVANSECQEITEENEQDQEDDEEAQLISSTNFPLYHKSRTVLSKIKAMEAGFVSVLLSQNKNNLNISSGFDLERWDNSKTLNLIEKFYGHLDPSEQLGASDWLQNMIGKMKHLIHSSPDDSNVTVDSLKTFVPVSRRKVNVSGAKFF